MDGEDEGGLGRSDGGEGGSKAQIRKPLPKIDESEKKVRVSPAARATSLGPDTPQYLVPAFTCR